MLFDALGQPLGATSQPENLAQSSLPTASTLPPLDASYNDGRGFVLPDVNINASGLLPPLDTSYNDGRGYALPDANINALGLFPPLDAGYNNGHGFAQQATSFNASGLLPPLDAGYNDGRGISLPSIGGDNIDTLLQIITDSGAAYALAPPATTSDTTYAPMLLLSSFEYRHDRVPLLGGFDVELTPEPPAGIFVTGRIFAPLGDGFGAEYNSAPLVANSNVAHTSLPLTFGFDAALPTIHLDADLDTAHTLVSLGGGFSATNTLALLAADFGAAPTSSHAATSCTAYLNMAQLPPECHIGNLWKESEDDASAASASTQNGSTSTTNNSSDLVRLEAMSVLGGPFIIISLDMMPAISNLITRRDSALTGVGQQELDQQSGAIQGYKNWTCDLPEMGSTFLIRRGPEYRQMRDNFHRRLKLNKGIGSVVPRPLMCYFLATLVFTPLDLLSSGILENAFKRVTNMDLRSQHIVTEKGCKSLLSIDLCLMVRQWMQELCLLIVITKSHQKSLNIASNCYAEYEKRGRDNGNLGFDFDPTGDIAKDMLLRNTFDSRALLGIFPDEVKALLKHLPILVRGQFHDEIVDRLTTASDVVE
ncbi:hypothetical protein GGI09_001738 [Coemansia sp. S100]|nr:hypothetical protein LPJ71_001989 [Coemansia sp. S17]KAJ2101476.1 hypothetical protein GGI09_001738 [Coemansia sp. S100]KAJ2108400.1 hypothetical protein GGI16_001152 [Coemansia sp. S142-1]